MATRCAFQLCRRPAKGLVRLVALDVANRSAPADVPMCEPDSDIVGVAVERRVPIHLTMEGVVYLGDLDEQIPRRA